MQKCTESIEKTDDLDPLFEQFFTITNSTGKSYMEKYDSVKSTK